MGEVGNRVASGNDRAWFDDGLHELLAGVVIALFFTCLSLEERHRWTAAVAFIPVFACWLWLQLRFREVLAWGKQHLVFPRLGVQAPPPWLRGDPTSSLTTLGLSGRPAPVTPPRPISRWRWSLALSGAALGSMLPFAFLRIGEAYVLASVAIAVCLCLGAKPVGVPWRLALLVVFWGIALWRIGPAPATDVGFFLFFGGLGGCAILAGGISLALFVAGHPVRPHLAGGV